MILFKNISNNTPFKLFEEFYDEARKVNQPYIEAASISSYNKTKDEISSRFVNIKELNKNNFFFYTNYESPKAIDFSEHNQVSLNFFWNMASIQIRIKGNIFKASEEKSDIHFQSRNEKKNLLSIISKQSRPMKSYEDFRNSFSKNYSKISKENLQKRPKYWGGYLIQPYYFEFWTGEEFRINKRISYNYYKNIWKREILEP